MSTNSQYFEVNKTTWNTKVKVHAKSEMYAMEAFKKGMTISSISQRSPLHKRI